MMIMAVYYLKRSFEILRQKGPVELLKTMVIHTSRNIKSIILRKLDPQNTRRFKFNTWLNNLQNHIRYDAPPDPYKTIDIKPSKIEYMVGRDRKFNPRCVKMPQQGGLAQTKSGEWDVEHRIDIDENWIIRGLIERFEKEKDWEDTITYKKGLEKLNQTNTHEKKCFENRHDYLLQKCSRYDDLFQDIKNNGYKSGHDGNRVIPNENQPVRDGLEVLVTIDRKGEINFFESNHRFGIAKVLDIEIPAHVVCRHKKWQEVRDRISENGLSKENKGLRHHPDLQDILSATP